MLHFLYNAKCMNLVRLAALCAAVALGIVLMTGQAKAELGDRYDLTPPKPMQYESLQPSVGGDGYNSWQRRNELQERQMEDYRAESLRQERQRQRDAAVSGGGGYPGGTPGVNPPFGVYSPDGSMKLCTKGFNGSLYCQ
jgi:hypothetical protein